MPTPTETLKRIERALPAIIQNFGTPVYVYDEQGILDRGTALIRAMRHLPGGFQQFYAVKAWNNPANLRLQQRMGFGFDCSSMYEMHLVELIGNTRGRFILTSNNSRSEWFEEANRQGGIINLDDISLIKKVRDFPRQICFRINPGDKVSLPGMRLQSFGKTKKQKYGIMWEEIAKAYGLAKRRGAEIFGIHMMIGSNCRDEKYFFNILKLLLKACEIVEKATGEQVLFIDVGGGFGIPYRPGEPELDMNRIGEVYAEILSAFMRLHGYAPTLYTEMGRWMTGPFGVLIAKVINRKEIYQTHVGLDVGMNGLMRHGMYGAYHEVKIYGSEGRRKMEVVNGVGQICENIDRIVTQRTLPVSRIGDHWFIQDTGAHGIVMVFRYNGTMAPPEVMLRTDEQLELIRRAETHDDLDATLRFEPKVVKAY
ncbi:MAG TPA: diaminopimelate decarboxylase [Candidatus Paceibacterota bacterium]